MLAGRISSALCVLALGLAAAGASAADSEAGRPVAVVNGQAITRAEFGRSLLLSLGRGALESYVDRVLIAQEARRMGVRVTDRELQERREVELALRLRAAEQGMRLSPEEFREAVANRGMDIEQVRRELADTISPDALRSKLLAEKLLEPYVNLSDAALRAYYERTRGRRFAAAHIALADRRQAERLLQVLQERRDLWPDAVITYSLDRASRPYKGRIGPVPAASALGKVLAEMKPGELTLWQEGRVWHILWLIGEVPDSGEDFEQIKERLAAELLAERTHSRLYDLLADLWEESRVVVNLSADPEARRLLGEDVAAYVNGEVVRTDALAEALVREFGPAMLPVYIERTLIFQEAARRGIEVPEEEVEARLEAIGRRLVADQAAERGMSVGELQGLVTGGQAGVEELADRLVRESVSVDDVRAALLAERLVAGDVQVTEQEIQDAYREYGGERFVVRDLSTETRGKAENILQRLAQGAAFELLMMTESDEPGRWLESSGLSVVTATHPWYERVKDLKPGQVSGIFQQDGKYHIIKVVEHHLPSDRPPLETVRDKLEREVFLRKAAVRIRALLIKLRAESEINIALR